MFTGGEITILKECIREDILSLIKAQTHETNKSDGVQLSTQDVVTELHKKIIIRIEIIRKLEKESLVAYVEGR